MTYHDGQMLVVTLVGDDVEASDPRWLRVWLLAERLSVEAAEPPQQIVARWRKHAEIVWEFEDELEVER